jgi:tetrahydromethanopterin S-methyltransferase subunit B
MTKLNFYKELCYSDSLYDENGNTIEDICYPSLINVITELCDRIEKLEQRLEDLAPSMSDTFGPTGLIGDPQ